jgi:hypothetical protein
MATQRGLGGDGGGSTAATSPNVLNENLIPGFEDHLSASEFFTPDTFVSRYLSPHGAGFSLEPRIFQSAWFRPHNVSEEVANLYLVGAGTHPGAGIPSVVTSSEVLTKLVPDAPRPFAYTGDEARGGMIDQADLDHCRAAIGKVPIPSTRRRSFCPPACATRRWRFMRSAGWPMTRWISATTSPPPCWICATVLTSPMPGRPETRPPTGPWPISSRPTTCPARCPRRCWKGLAWDGMERRYASLSDLRSYSARVASAVGAMMCVLMEVRDPHALARACDLGVAMQLTNIARDVGEDARAGRLYLPTDWLEEDGIDIDAFLADPNPSPADPPHGEAPAGRGQSPLLPVGTRDRAAPLWTFAPASSPRAIATTPSAAS